MDHPYRFAEVVLPLAVGDTFTFGIPTELLPAVEIGKRVVVQFGRGNKSYSGVLVELHARAPVGLRVKNIISVLDEVPILLPYQLKFWRSIASHYMCHMGEVMHVALPGMLVLSSDTRLVRTDAPMHGKLPKGANILLEALNIQEVISLRTAGDILGIKDPMPVIRTLIANGALVLEEELREQYRPVMVDHVHLNCETSQIEEQLQAWFDELEKAPKQLNVLMKYVEMSQCLKGIPRPVRRKELQKRSQADASTIKALVRRSMIRIEKVEAGTQRTDPSAQRSMTLTKHQRTALNEIESGYQQHRTCLLRGVTSSGKTEVYTSLIKKVLDQKKQVLYLLPEIALTVQMVDRIADRCGVPVAVFHSRSGPREQAQLWMEMMNAPEKYPIVMGARSAIFLPFHHLGLIVVDEEHDPSYKQRDPAPRYNARDMAVLMAENIDAQVVLGSATPSLESVHNVQQGKYAQAQLQQRFEGVQLPEVRVADIRVAQKKRMMKGHFTPLLLERIVATLKAREQVILFKNRRGFAPVLQCSSCGWIPECDQCDVSLTYHKRDDIQRCHYCGRSYAPVNACLACGSKKMQMLGSGTERIEEELVELFPDATIARMDQDTTRGKKGFKRLMGDLIDGTIDILVGTQMVTKGLDLDRVTLVGILNADALMSFPDLRAHERAFQLMAQVAGRAGRRGQQSMVIIQTYEPDSPVIKAVVAHDLGGIDARELAMRQAHFYPPYSRMVRISLRGKKEPMVAHMAQQLVSELSVEFAERTLGPETPNVAWVRGMHIRNVVVKMKKSRFVHERSVLSRIIQTMEANKEFRAVRVTIDVDPY